MAFRTGDRSKKGGGGSIELQDPEEHLAEISAKGLRWNCRLIRQNLNDSCPFQGARQSVLGARGAVALLWIWP